MSQKQETENWGADRHQHDPIAELQAEVDGKPYLALEYIDGGTLSDNR